MANPETTFFFFSIRCPERSTLSHPVESQALRMLPSKSNRQVGARVAADLGFETGLLKLNAIYASVSTRAIDRLSGKTFYQVHPSHSRYEDLIEWLIMYQLQAPSKQDSGTQLMRDVGEPVQGFMIPYNLSLMTTLNPVRSHL
jgi:hypothetical protein